MSATNGATRAKVLLVDDDPANRLALKADLDGLGLTLVDAASGEEALRRLRETRFAVVLLDVQMPGLDGFETARLLRGRDDTRHTPIIFQTAHRADRATVESAYALGAVDLLEKPALPVVLRAKVAGCVELFEQRRQLEERSVELRESEERFRLLVDGTKEHAIFLLDPGGHIVSWNAGAERIKGYQADEIIGKHLSCFYPGEDVAARKPEQELHIAAAEGRSEDEGWRVRKDGTRFWASVITTALRDEAGILKGFSKITRDLTERRRSEERFRLIVDSAPTGMVLIGQDGTICLANAQVGESFGYGSGELIGKAVEVLVPDRFRERHVLDRTTFSAAPHPRRMGRGNELFGRRKDGSEFPVEIGLQPITMDEGNFVLASVIDITERKRAENELRTSEELARSILNAITAHIAVLNDKGNIVAVNSAWERFALANDNADMSRSGVGANYLKVCRQAVQAGDEQALQVLDGLERILKGSLQDFRIEYPCHSQTEERWFLLHARPLSTRLGGAVVSHTSITELKRTEAALRESEARFRQLADSIPQLVWMAHADGRIYWYNKQWYEYTGTTHEQMEGWGWQSVHDPAELPRVLERWRASITTGEPFDMVFPLRRADGQFGSFLTRVIPVRSPEGKIIQWFGTSTDITERVQMEASLRRSQKELEGQIRERKQAEEALRQAHDRLEQRVGERTVQLTELNESLRREIEERQATEARLRDHAEEIETLMDVLPVSILIARDPECRHITGNRATYELLRVRQGANVSKSAPLNERPAFRVFRGGVELAPEELPMQRAIAIGTEVRNAELDLVFEDGEMRAIYGFAAPLFDANRRVRGCIGAFIDISERRRLENSLRESEERYRAVVEDQTEVVSRFRADGTFLFVNDVYCRTFGKSADEIIGQRWVPVAHPDDVPAVKAQLAKLSPEHPVVRVENRVFDGAVRVRWMEFVNRGFFGPDGELMEIQSVGRDVTERILAEEQLRLSEERMRLAMEAAQVSTWDWDMAAGKVIWSDNLESYLGMAARTFGGTFDAFRALVHPDDRQQIAAALDEALQQRKPYQVEFRMIRPDGSVQWTATKGRAFYNPKGRPVRMLGVDVDITERKQAEDAIRAALAERETLLKEVHHRVKNNLQVISSLLHMQSLHADKASVESFRESQHRVRSMALVHERLYRSQDFVRVDFKDYIESLANYLFRSYHASADHICLEVDVHGVRLPIDAAVPCGLLVNELISNCLKHAFLGRQEGVIRVELVPVTEAEAILCVSDDGVGLPPQVNPETAETFGMQLIVALVDQLHGTLEVIRQDGTKVRVVFPLVK